MQSESFIFSYLLFKEQIYDTIFHQRTIGILSFIIRIHSYQFNPALLKNIRYLCKVELSKEISDYIEKTHAKDIFHSSKSFNTSKKIYATWNQELLAPNENQSNENINTMIPKTIEFQSRSLLR